MLNRRSFVSAALALGTGSFALGFSSAHAVELAPYDAATVEKLIKSGKPVVLHVYASWCLQCHAQASILSSLPADKYKGVSFFRVDYDAQKDIVAALKCPRSTVISFKGGKEVTRMSWGTAEKDVVDVLNTVA